MKIISQRVRLRCEVGFTTLLNYKAAMPERVICATPGNHGQSVAFAAMTAGVEVVIVVPRGSLLRKTLPLKDAGQKTPGKGDDFVESLRFAEIMAQKENLH